MMFGKNIVEKAKLEYNMPRFMG